MATIAEFKEIEKSTPITMPLMICAPHGIGKSEVISQIYREKGYRVEILFLGQMGDSGDLLGLPDRKEVVVGEGKTQRTEKFTTFCPPMWWPKNENEKVCLFLDELNRAKPEIHQVVMDLVLNRKLADRKLPDSCRIVSAINPLEGGNYQVEELDPALMDRFNFYNFKPSFDEWFDWATKEKVNKNVIGFLMKNTVHMDAPVDDMQAGKVYPSRRSWKRVSDIMNSNQELEKNDLLLRTVLVGIVGEAVTSAFSKYVRENNKGISASSVLENFTPDLKKKILALDIQNQVHLNREICYWFDEKSTAGWLKDKEEAAKYANNLIKYLDCPPLEVVADFFGLMSQHNKDKKAWPREILNIDADIKKRFVDSIAGTSDK